MRISKQDYATLRGAMAVTSAAKPGARAAYRDSGLSEKRYRWDMCYASHAEGMRLDQWVCVHLYPEGITDAHIDTALRRIVAELDQGPIVQEVAG